MANLRSSSSLDSLQPMLNDLTVQIGKALRASSKRPGRRDVAQVQSTLQSHMPKTIETFHWALDDLEDEIVTAKAVLQRDLGKYRTQEQIQPPKSSTMQALNVQTARAVTDTQASEPPSFSQQAPTAPNAPMAPVPDMGGGIVKAVPTPILSPNQAVTMIKLEPTSAAPQAVMEPAAEDIKQMDLKPAVTAPAAPEAVMDDVFGLDIPGSGNNGHGGEFNFTDITFGLAPPNTESQNQGGQQQIEIDLSTFGNDDLSSLDNMLAMDVSEIAPTTSEAPNAPSTSAPAGTTENNASAASSGNVQTANNLDDIFDLDGDGTMDLSMDLGGSGDGSNFDNVFFADKLDDSSDKFDEAFFHIP